MGLRKDCNKNTKKTKGEKQKRSQWKIKSGGENCLLLLEARNSKVDLFETEEGLSKKNDNGKVREREKRKREWTHIKVPQVIKDINREPHRIVTVRILTTPVTHLVVIPITVLQPNLIRMMMEPNPVRRKLRNRVLLVREANDGPVVHKKKKNE